MNEEPAQWDGPYGPLERLKDGLIAIQARQTRAQMDGGHSDIEADHAEADRLLLAYINDDEVSATFEAIERWYA